MPELAQSITARFAGQTVTFMLQRDPRATASLEAAIGSPFAAFNRFGRGAWTPGDVRAVLSHAYPGAKLMHALTRVDAVDTAIQGRPMATYAGLATKVLQAFLFGINPENAVFDEASPF